MKTQSNALKKLNDNNKKKQTDDVPGPVLSISYVLYSFPIAAVTNHYKLSGLKQIHSLTVVK